MGFPEPLGRYGTNEVIPLADFRARVDAETLGEGVGYYGWETHESSDIVDLQAIEDPSPPHLFDHVVWYAGKTDRDVIPTWFT